MMKQEDPFQRAMDQGHSAAWDQRWDQAAEFYRQALEISPNHPSAVTSLALAYYELQEYQEALQYYTQAARSSPGDPVPFEKLAQIYERLGNPARSIAAAQQAADLYLKSQDVDKAIENWNRSLALDPDNLKARSRLAVLFERMRKEKQAVAEYLHIAALFQHTNELEKAFRTIQHAIQVFPGSDAARQALDLLKQGRLLPKPARSSAHSAQQPDALQSTANFSPDGHLQEQGPDPVAEARQSALAFLAGMLFEAPEEDQSGVSGSRRGLQTVVRSGLSLGDRSPRQANPARVLRHLGQLVDLQIQDEKKRALKELERAVEAGLNHPAADFDLGLLYIDTGLAESAINPLRQALSHPDYALGGHLLLGQALYRMDRLSEAAVEYLEALRLADAEVVPAEQEEDLRLLYEPLVQAQSQQNDRDAQKRLCENIEEILLRPGWRERLRNARKQLPIQETSGSPIPLAEILAQARSSQVVEQLGTVNQLAAAGYLQSAMEEAFYALHQAPTYLPLHAYMGDLLLKQNRLPEAVAKLLVVARTYSIRGETRRAEDLYRKVIELAPMDLEAHNLLIEQLVALGQLNDAIEATLDLGDVYYDLADMDMVRKVYAEALRLAQGPAVERSWRVKILYRMADLDLQRLDFRQALRNFEAILILQPDDEKARLKLVELNYRLGQESLALSEVDNFVAYLGSKGQKEKAVSFLEDMIQDHGNRPPIHRRLAEIYTQMGRFQNAIVQYNAAGEGFLKAGDRAGAVGAIEAILKLKPQNAGEYQQLLRKLKGK